MTAGGLILPLKAANLLRAALFRQHRVERRADYLLRPEKSPWVGTMTHRLASGDERSIILAGRHRVETPR